MAIPGKKNKRKNKADFPCSLQENENGDGVVVHLRKKERIIVLGSDSSFFDVTFKSARKVSAKGRPASPSSTSLIRLYRATERSSG